MPGVRESGRPVRGHHEDHAMAFGDRPRHRPRRQEGLIVRVGMDEEECPAAHGHIL